MRADWKSRSRTASRPPSSPIGISRHARHLDAALAATIDRYHPHLVVLAGFMRILTPGFRRALQRPDDQYPSVAAAGVHGRRHASARARCRREDSRLHGAFRRTEALDHGPIIAQAAVPVRDDDNADSLAARVLAEEHRILPEAVRLFCAKRLVINGQRVSVSGEL